MTIAGPVFTEESTFPLFFLLVYGPPILVGAGALYFVGRRIRPRLWRPGIAAMALAASALVVVGGAALLRWISFERAQGREARQLDFATFVPEGYRASHLEPFVAAHARMLTGTFQAGGRTLYVTQERAGPVDASDPAQCRIMVAGPLAVHPAALGPCTRRGGALVTAEAVYAVRRGTLIEVRSAEDRVDDAVALIGALRPVDPEAIDFAR